MKRWAVLAGWRARLLSCRRTQRPAQRCAGLCVQMEAPGIEPGSENRFTTATTCVVRPWMFPRAGWQTTHSRISPLYFAGTPKAHVPASPDLRYPQSRPGRASSWALAGVTKSYAARAKLLFAVGSLSSVLSGARRPEHAATASLTPSKPVAPSGVQSSPIQAKRNWAAARTDSSTRLVKRWSHMVWLNHLHAISTGGLRFV